MTAELETQGLKIWGGKKRKASEKSIVMESWLYKAFSGTFWIALNI